MLLKIREVTAGKFSYFIVAVISVPFALWGVNYYFQGGFDPVVVEVGAGEITLSEFDRRLNERKRQLESQLDASRMPPDEAIRREVIGTLVGIELMEQEAEEYGYYVPDAQLARAIVQIPAFAVDGRFDRERYLNILSARRQSQTGFEEELRQDLLRTQMQMLVGESSFTLSGEQSEYERFLFQERRVRYLEFPMERYIEPESIASTRVQAYYEENREQFKTTDKIAFKYVELKVEDVAAGLSVSEEDLHAYYDANRDLFITPERRTFAHILIDPARHGGETARERAAEVAARLEAGDDFAELAAEYSDDSLTAEQGGELPPFTREDLDEGVADAVFDLEPGDFSEPVSSDYGLQIFQLLSSESSQAKTFAEIRDEVDERARLDRAQNVYAETLVLMENLAYEYPDNLDALAEAVAGELGVAVEVKATSLLDTSKREDVLRYPQVLRAAYSDAVLQDADNSEVLEVVPGHSLVIRVDEGDYEPGRQQSFEEVRGEILATLLRDDAWVQASRAMDEALKQITEDDATFDQISREQLLPLHDSGFIRRGEGQETPTISQVAFLLPEVVGSRGRTRMSSTDSYALVELLEVRDGEVSPEEKPELSFARDEFNAALQGTLESVSLEIHEDRFGDDAEQ